MDESKNIKFGIFDHFTQSFGTGGITSIFSLNYRECIISTTKEIIKIERNIVKMKHPLKFSTCLVVPDTEFLVGVTTKFGEIYIYQISDLSHPLLERYQTNHSGIFHIFYSAKSRLLVTIGLGIKVFKFDYTISRISVVKPTVSLSLYAEFAPEYNTTIIVPPYFDDENELILLPTPNGISSYTLDGKEIAVLSRFPASLTTVYALQKKSRKLLTYDSDNGMALWSSYPPQIIQQFPTAGSILAIIFIDSENAVCLNSHLVLFYLNIKTGRTFYCVTLEKRPHRLFLIYLDNIPILCLCFHSLLRAMKLVIPWSVWNLNIDNALQMRRCNKYCDAARVLIETNNSFIKLYSPRDNSKLAVATPSYAVHPVSYLYDRGIVEQFTFDAENCLYNTTVLQTATSSGNKRDVLFIILEDGTIVGYDTGDALCQESMLIPGKAAFMVICYLANKWCYAVSSKQSDLFIYDYDSLKQIRHFTVLDDFLIRMFFHLESGCIVMVFKKKTVLFDMDKGQIIDAVNIKGNRITALFADFITYGYKSGHLTHVKIVDKSFVLQCKPENMQRPHSASVSGFSFSQQTWLSSSLDGSVIIWDYNFEKVCQVILPLPIYSCLLMNGKRDLLVATETEVMRIKCSVVFSEGEFDNEITEIDNFDRLNDALYKEPIIAGDDLALLNDVYSSSEDKSKKDRKSKKSGKKVPDFSFSVKSLTPVINNLSNSTDQQSSNKETRPSKPEEETGESIQKKLEMMQAMGGFGGPPIPGMAISSPPSNSNTSGNNGNDVNNEDNNKNDKDNSNDKNKDESEDNKKKLNDEKEKETEKRKKRPQKDEKSLTDFINDSMEQEKQSAKRKKVKKPKVNETPVDDKREQFSEEKAKGLMDNLFANKKPAIPPSSAKKEAGKGIDFGALAKQFHKDEDPLSLKAPDKTQYRQNDKNNNEDGDNGDNDKDLVIKENKQNQGNNGNAGKTNNNEKNAQNKPAPVTKPKDMPNSTTSNHGVKPKDKPSQKTETPSNSNVNANSNANANSNSNAKTNEKVKSKKGRKSAKGKADGASKANSNKNPNPKEKENSTNSNSIKNNVNKSIISIPNSPLKDNKNGLNQPGGNCKNNSLNANSVDDSFNGDVNPNNKCNLNSDNNGNDKSKNTDSNGQLGSEANCDSGSKTDSSTVDSEIYDPNRKNANKNVEKIDILIQTDASYLLGNFVPDKDINDDENGFNSPHLPSSLIDSKSPRNSKNNENNIMETNTKEIKMNSPYPSSYLSSNQNEENNDSFSHSGNIPKGEINDQINQNNEIDEDSQRPRCPTPPPIRWNRVSVKQQSPKRARTPPMKKYPSPRYRDPPPNIIIDREAVLLLYGRGRLDLQPLVDRIEREKAYKSYIHLSFEHVMKQKIDFSKTFASRARFRNRDLLHTRPVNDPDEIYIDAAEQKMRMMSSSAPFRINSVNSNFQYYFDSISRTAEEQNEQKEEGLPKMQEMQYSPRPMNLIASQKKQQNKSIVLPYGFSSGSPNSARRSAARSERNSAGNQEQQTANITPTGNIDSLNSINNYETNNNNDDNTNNNYGLNLNTKPSSVRGEFENDEDDSLNEIFSSRRNAKSARGAPFKKTWTITMPRPTMLAMVGPGMQRSQAAGDDNNKVDLLESAVMSKMPKLGIAKRAKSVRTGRNGVGGFSSTFTKGEMLPKINRSPLITQATKGWQNQARESKFALENTVPLGNVLIQMK